MTKTNAKKFKNKLIGIVGEKNVLTDDIDLLSYSTDASMIKGNALAVIFPKSATDVRKIVRFAKLNGLDIVPRGSGTGLAGGAVPKDSLVMDLSRMNRIWLNKKTKVATVEPGVVLSVLNDMLAKHGLFFPIIPSSQKECTIGGMISTNAAGYRAIRYGKTSDWVDEIEVVDGTGKLLDMKKNNFFIGSEGILGIVTKAKIRLTTPPKLGSISVISYPSVHDMVQELLIEKSKPSVLALEYMDEFCSELVGLKRKYHLIVEHDDDSGKITDPEAILEIIETREGLGPKLCANEFMLYEDPLIEHDKLEKFLKWLKDKDIPSFGHIGIGIIHPQFKISQKDLIAKMQEFVKKIGGKVSGEHGIGLSKRKFYSNPALKKLKQKYDPENILNKGKVI